MFARVLLFKMRGAPEWHSLAKEETFPGEGGNPSVILLPLSRLVSAIY